MNERSQLSPWGIGSVVALKTHPYFSDLNNASIILAGDPLLLSPLMVIVETFIQGKSHYDENTGLEISEKGSYQYRCMWYSSKAHQFEDSTFSSRLLKLIFLFDADGFQEHDKALKSYASVVRFKTAKIELSKKKSFIKHSDVSETTNRKTITSDLSFVSPVMQVVGTVKNESKEPLIDLKTGERRKFISRLLIKCKYYNSSSSKFSESLVPIEALEFVFSTNSEKLRLIKKVIEENGYLKTSCSINDFPFTLLKPEALNFKDGQYYLEAFDYLKDKRDEILIDQSDNQFQISSFRKAELPDFQEAAGKLTIKSINRSNLAEMLNTSNANGLYRILYEDLNAKMTERTIGQCSIIDSEGVVTSGSLESRSYLKAYCFLRKAQRFFRIDRVKTIQVLDL